MYLKFLSKLFELYYIFKKSFEHDKIQMSLSGQ